MLKLSRIFTAAAVILFATSAWAQTLGPTTYTNRLNPGYLPSLWYAPGWRGPIVTNQAFPTLDTIVLMYPFSTTDASLTAQAMGVRTNTGLAGCAIKMAVWASDPATAHPTGLPLVGSNTGQACSSSATSASISISYTFKQGVIYWFGVAVTTSASNFVSLSNTSNDLGFVMGTSSILSSTVGTLSTPYTYATDIMALDMTSAVFTIAVLTGMPLLHVQCNATAC